MDEIRQILFIAPKLYKLYWYKSSEKSSYKLVIDVEYDKKKNEYFPFLKRKDCKQRM